MDDFTPADLPSPGVFDPQSVIVPVELVSYDHSPIAPFLEIGSNPSGDLTAYEHGGLGSWETPEE